MNWPLWGFIVVVYAAGMWWIQRRQWRLALYIWSAFGLAFLLIHAAVLLNGHMWLASLEAQQLKDLMALVGVRLERVDSAVLMVPDATGWSGLRIGIESSTLIELAVFSGLLLFYPKLSGRRRVLSLVAGLGGTYLLNLFRLSLIVLMIMIWGKPAVPLAHAVVGRLVYFGGVVILYWFLLTRPTLSIVNHFIRETGRESR